MNDFISYLDKVESLVKAKRYDEAWSVSNEGLIKIKGEDKYMMYYQMANIVAREKKWFDALEKMGFVIFYLKGLGGVSHKKFDAPWAFPCSWRVKCYGIKTFTS